MSGNTFDPRPDWMRRCPPEVPLDDDELRVVGRILAGAILVAALALSGLGWLLVRRLIA